MRILETKDIVRLLREDVAKAGSQVAWAQKFGIDRTIINKVLQEKKLPTKQMIIALGLRIVVVSDD